MNWGTKILIGMGLFMAFILAMGTKMIISSGDDDLLEKDYYEQGLEYNKVYNKKDLAVKNGVVPEISILSGELRILFKSPAQYTLTCKRPSDSSLDRIYKGKTPEDLTLIITAADLKPGPWLLRLEFSAGGKLYLVDQEINMP
ncbi:MAG: FixH family protein [Daejeonella sp.]